MTDVTGFGLLGHLHELARASGLAAEVDAAAVPALRRRRGAARGRARAVSGGSRRNREHAEGFSVLRRRRGARGARRLVCDATTSGGLLVAVDPARAAEVPGPVVGRLAAGDPGAIAVA